MYGNIYALNLKLKLFTSEYNALEIEITKFEGIENWN